MSLQKLRKQIYNLSVMERLTLMEAIAQSLQQELRPRPDQAARMGALTRLRGMAKTDEPSPTDVEATEAYVNYLIGEIQIMRVLVDTNIVLDFILDHQPFVEEASTLL